MNNYRIVLKGLKTNLSYFYFIVIMAFPVVMSEIKNLKFDYILQHNAYGHFSFWLNFNSVLLWISILSLLLLPGLYYLFYKKLISNSENLSFLDALKKYSGSFWLTLLLFLLLCLVLLIPYFLYLLYIHLGGSPLPVLRQIILEITFFIQFYLFLFALPGIYYLQTKAVEAMKFSILFAWKNIKQNYLFIILILFQLAVIYLSDYFHSEPGSSNFKIILLPSLTFLNQFLQMLLFGSAILYLHKKNDYALHILDQIKSN